MKEWKFADPPNVAVSSDKSIFKRDDWIAYVVHEADDDDIDNDEGGSWRFHSSDTRDWDEREIMLVGLQEVIRLDQSILALAEFAERLACLAQFQIGAVAARQIASDTLQRQRMTPQPLRSELALVCRSPERAAHPDASAPWC